MPDPGGDYWRRSRGEARGWPLPPRRRRVLLKVLAPTQSSLPGGTLFLVSLGWVEQGVDTAVVDCNCMQIARDAVPRQPQ